MDLWAVDSALIGLGILGAIGLIGEVIRYRLRLPFASRVFTFLAALIVLGVIYLDPMGLIEAKTPRTPSTTQPVSP